VILLMKLFQDVFAILIEEIKTIGLINTTFFYKPSNFYNIN
jgi:hypothetical protein